LDLRSLALHGGLIALLFALNFVLPVWQQGSLARVMVLACHAMAYNLLFGYTGLLSLGHAMFFAAGMYGLALPMQHLGTPAPLAFGIALASGAMLALAVGLLALRTRDVAFMIVTLMLAQAVYLVILIAAPWTRGDEGFALSAGLRQVAGLDLTRPHLRYGLAWALFTATMLATLALVRHPAGKALVAIRENEARAELLGYDTRRLRLAALVISGTLSALSGAGYALLFGSASASFASVQYSILPLLWVLLGGAGTVIGPFIGTLFMFWLIDIASDLTPAYMLVAGAVLVALALFAPQGLAGLVRARLWRWLP
jgi:branched-chain amino acid transport system permease protein